MTTILSIIRMEKFTIDVSITLSLYKIGDLFPAIIRSIAPSKQSMEHIRLI